MTHNNYQSHVINAPFEAYEGDEPYIFISYKHSDYEIVYPVIKKLHDAGFNIWYDANLEKGKYYDIQIADHIINSALFITFITEEAIRCSRDEEDYLIKELSVAIKGKKERLPIFLEDVELEGFYLMHYLGKQSIFKHEYGDNEEMFIDACINAFKNIDIEPSDDRETPQKLEEKVHDFSQLANAINNGVKKISIESDIHFDNEIALSMDDLTIDGNGHTFDGSEKTRIFNCSGKNITLKNIILVNGFCDEKGGAIYNTGKLAIIKSSLFENRANLDGGAINNEGELSLEESVLRDNAANLDGGAICNKGTLTIDKSTFNANTAQYGGSIRNKGELNIVESTCNANTAKNNGGTIMNDGKLSIISSIFIKNSAQYGGVIYNNGGESNITESILSQNEVNGISGGGAICNIKGEVNITQSTFNKNASDLDGGAIKNSGIIRITLSEFNENTASRFGGALHNDEGEMNVSESSLADNTAKRGGAIRNYGDFSIMHSNLHKNNARQGGAINNGKTLKIMSCEILANESPENIVLNTDSMQAHNINLCENQSKCAIMNDSGLSNLGILNCSFMNNDIEESVLCNNGKFCNIDRVIFENNLSQENSLNIINNSELTIISPNVKDNGKTILNNGYIFIKISSPDFENKIYGDGTFEGIL